MIININKYVAIIVLLYDIKLKSLAIVIQKTKLFAFFLFSRNQTKIYKRDYCHLLSTFHDFYNSDGALYLKVALTVNRNHKYLKSM